MTPLFALVCAGLSFWAGLYLVGWQFLTGIVWFGGCIAWGYWYAFGEVKPAKKRRSLKQALKQFICVHDYPTLGAEPRIAARVQRRHSDEYWYVERDHVCSKCGHVFCDAGLEFVGGAKAFLNREGVHAEREEVKP